MNVHEGVARRFEDQVDERLDPHPRLPHVLRRRVERLRLRVDERRSDDDVRQLKLDVLLSRQRAEVDGRVELGHAVLGRLGLELDAQIFDGHRFGSGRVASLGLLVTVAHLAAVVKVVDLLVGALRGGRYDESGNGNIGGGSKRTQPEQNPAHTQKPVNFSPPPPH